MQYQSETHFKLMELFEHLSVKSQAGKLRVQHSSRSQAAWDKKEFELVCGLRTCISSSKAGVRNADCAPCGKERLRIRVQLIRHRHPVATCGNINKADRGGVSGKLEVKAGKRESFDGGVFQTVLSIDVSACLT